MLSNIKNGSLSVSFEDETGITLTSPSDISLNAGGEIAINTPSNINISAQGQIVMTNGKLSNVSLEGEINVLGGATISNGSDRTAFSKFTDDEPQQVQLVALKGLEGRLITKDSAKLLKDANGNDISFLDACKAENALNSVDLINALNGNMPSFGAVIVNGNSNSGADNSNSDNSSWNQWDLSAAETWGNGAIIGASTIQTAGDVGGKYIPKVISNAIKPTYSFEFKNIMAAKAAENAERFKTIGKVGAKGVWVGVGIDLYISYQDDKEKLGSERARSNAAVNAAFDVGGIVIPAEAGAAIGSVVPVFGTATGAIAGFVLGLVYTGATQVWKPGGESIINSR